MEEDSPSIVAPTIGYSNDQPDFLNLNAVTFVSCSYASPSALQEEADATPVDLQFNYELFTAEGADVQEATAEFEGALLGGVAETLGLLSCNERRKSKGLILRGLMGEPAVDGISSEPVDYVTDFECTTKMLDSSKLSEATCTSISGYMTAWLPNTSSRRHLSEASVYEAIENFISKSYTSDNIVGVSYIPDVQEEVVNEPVIAESKTTSGRANVLQTDDSSWEFLPGAGLLAVIVSLLALVGLVHVIKRKRTDNSDNTSPSIAAIEPELSSEMGSEPPTPKVGLRRAFSAAETDVCSVVTEDYTTQYTEDNFIKRMSTYGSAWGERTRSWFSRDEEKEQEDVVLSREEDDMPSEMGEEICVDDLSCEI